MILTEIGDEKMLSRAMKEAIKVSLAFTSAIVLAIFFGWDKPYWAAITVVTLASNESFSHSIKAAHNRILGTFVGASMAIGLVAFFAQDRFLFIGSFILLAGIFTAMSYDRKNGYFFRIAFIVCALISFMGSFDDAISVKIIFLRLQETILGVVVFSLVYQFLWPMNSEVEFYEQQKSTSKGLHDLVVELTECVSGKKAYTQETLADYQARLLAMSNNIKSHSLILDLPAAGSYQLSQQRKHWRKLTLASDEAIVKLQAWLDKAAPLVNNTALPSDSEHQQGSTLLSELANEAVIIELNEQLIEISDTVSLIQEARRELHKSAGQLNHSFDAVEKIKVTSHWQHVIKQWNNPTPLSIRLKDSAIVMVSLMASFALWIYLPLPNGYMFPMLAAVFAINLVAMPKFIVNQALVGMCVSGTLVLLQYTFIMPALTEIWQLAAFYFINLLIIWRVCSTPELAVQKVIGANLLVVLTMSALYLTPSFDITASLNMFVQVFLALGVIRFFIAWCKEG